MQKFLVLDPDWEDETPVEEIANDPSDAVRKFYSGTLLETPPSLYHEKVVDGSGAATFGSIGETRVAQFYVTDESGQEFKIFFD